MWRKYNKTNQAKPHRFYISTYVVVLLISLAAPLIANTSKAYAGATTDQNEQHKRTQMAALKRCLENYLPGDIRTNVQNKVSEFNIFNSGEGKGPSIAVGYEIEGDGEKQCGELDDSVTDLGYSSKEQFFADIYRPCTAEQQLKDCALFTSKDEVIKKINKFIDDRSLQKAEKMRRLMHTFENKCATPDAGNPLESPGGNPNFIKINDSWFRWKSENQGSATLPVGQDMDPAHLTCKKISEELKDLGAYTTSNEFYKRAIAEEQCIAEGRGGDLVRCIEEKLAAGVAVPPGPGGGGAGTEGSGSAVECDAISWNALKWFLCPVIKIAEKAVGALDNLITYMLTFPTKQYFEDNDGMQKAWSRFRNLSIGLLLIAGLVMVISQAVGYGPFDAYTIKRVMPRMLFAVVFISISWSVLRLMIEFTNVAGVGIRNLIETSFGSESFGSVTFNNGAMAFGNLAGAAMGLSLGFMGILSLLGTALLGVLIAFVVLAMRQMVIIMLVVLAPLAIACYILPNTEKLWKMWWDFFIRAIFAFPIISMFIAIGHAFAYISSNSTGIDGSDSALKDTIASLIAFAAYFGPYFALPFAFRLAGGAVAQIGGLVNDRSRGAFDRMKNFRKQRSAENWQGMKEGSRFNGNNALSRRANRTLQTGTLISQAGINPGKWRSRTQAARSEVDFNSTMEAMEKSAAVKAVAPNDTLLAAGMHGRGTEADVRRYLEGQGQTGRELNQNVAAVMRAKSELGGHTGFSRMAAVAMAGTGTGYAGGPGEMAEAIARVSNGDHQLAGQLLNAARQKAQGANRVDLHGSSFGANLGAVNGIMAGTQTRGQVNETLTDAVLDSQSAGAIISGRNGGTANMVPAIQRRIQRAEAAVHAAYNGGSAQDRTDADRHFQQVLASTAGMLDAAGQVSPQNARLLADGVMSMNVQDHANRVQGTLAEHIEANRDNDEFREMRREYATSAAQQAQMAQQQQVPPGGTQTQGSDIRLKRNVSFYKTYRDIKLYKFQYIWSNQTYIGVIAQDILSTHPSAIHIDKNGYYSVDYSALGIRMVKIGSPITGKNRMLELLIRSCY